MNFIKFKNTFKDLKLIKTSTIKNFFPDFDLKNLTYWQKKWYILKLKKWVYIFSDLEIDEKILFFIANNLNEPSYIWLQTALSFYWIIPEWVFTITSISTKRINFLDTKIWKFKYFTIKKDLFWWYEARKWFFISDLEKTILDFLYFFPKYSQIEDFEELRFNKEFLKEKLNLQKIKKYLKIFENKQLEKRFNNLKNYIYA